MDREIPKEIRQKERNKKIIRYSSIGVASIVVIGVLISVLRAGVEAKDLVFSTVDTGVIEVSVSASGKVVPAFEEIINSPINSRILEVYKKGGDSVDVGTPILKLDLQSTETEYKSCWTKSRCVGISSISFVSIIRRSFPIWRCRLKFRQ